MKTQHHYFFFLLLLVTFAACRKDIDTVEVITIEPEIIPDTLVQGSFVGQVLSENAQPLVGATISFGTETTTTNQDGLYQLLRKQAQRKGAVLKIEHPDYFSSTAISRSTTEQLPFNTTTLLSKTISERFSATSGGEFDLPQDVKLSIPAGSLNRTDGSSYAGEVELATRWTDPTTTDKLDIFSLSASAKNATGEAVVLEKLVGLELALTAEDGTPLQLEEEERLELELPVAESESGDLPNEIDLFQWDFGTGEWKYIATCLLNSNRRYRCNIPGGTTLAGSFTCAISHERKFVDRILYNPDTTAVAYAQVRIQAVEGDFLLHTFTNNTGYFSAFVPVDTELELTIFDNCKNVILQRPLVERDVFDRRIFLTETVAEYTIFLQGQVESCTADSPITAQIVVEWAGHQKAYLVQPDGSYQIGVKLSCTELPLFTVRAYDLTTRQVSNPQLILPMEDTPYTLEDFRTCLPVDFYLEINTDTAQYEIYPATYCIGEDTEVNNLEIRALNYGVLFRSQFTYEQPTLYNNVDGEIVLPQPTITDYQTIHGRLQIQQIEVAQPAEGVLSGTFTGTLLPINSTTPLFVTGTYHARQTF